MDALRGVPASAGARENVRSVILTRRIARARAIGLAEIVGLGRILRDVVAGVVAGIGGDGVELGRLLGIERLGRASPGTTAQQGQADHDRSRQADPHPVPRSRGFTPNARTAFWCAQ